MKKLIVKMENEILDIKIKEKKLIRLIKLKMNDNKGD